MRVVYHISGVLRKGENATNFLGFDRQKTKNPAVTQVLFEMSGGQGRDRTGDTRIFSPLLYQLSYLAMGFRVVVSVEMVGAQGFEPWTQ